MIENMISGLGDVAFGAEVVPGGAVWEEVESFLIFAYGAVPSKGSGDSRCVLGAPHLGDELFGVSSARSGKAVSEADFEPL